MTTFIHTGKPVFRVFVENTNYRKAQKKKNDDRAGDPKKDFVGSSQCSSVFVEPMAWMLEVQGDQLRQSEGTLYCPKCKSRIGSWNWNGTRVALSSAKMNLTAFPSFQYHDVVAGAKPSQGFRYPRIRSADDRQARIAGGVCVVRFASPRSQTPLMPKASTEIEEFRT